MNFFEKWLDSIDMDDFSVFIEALYSETLEAGEYLYTQGDPIDYVYFIADGEIAVERPVIDFKFLFDLFQWEQQRLQSKRLAKQIEKNVKSPSYIPPNQDFHRNHGLYEKILKAEGIVTPKDCPGTKLGQRFLEGATIGHLDILYNRKTSSETLKCITETFVLKIPTAKFSAMFAKYETKLNLPTMNIYRRLP
jgi:CRP-like cAMP-binding protein